MLTSSDNRRHRAAARVATAAVVIGTVSAALTAGAALARGAGGADHVVIGTGPHAVYVGPPLLFGGDPARGETEQSYYARTGQHLPGLSTATPVDGPWWYGRPPVVGGDPASGETDASYYARTGRHLPRQ